MRKMVYHKDYHRDLPESERSSKSKVVSSDEELKSLGPDWGSHPSVSKAPKAIEEKKEVVIKDSDVSEEKPSPKWGKKSK